MDCSQISDLEDAIAEEFMAQSENILRLFSCRVFELIIDSRYPTSSSMKENCESYRSISSSRGASPIATARTSQFTESYDKFGLEAPLFHDVRCTVGAQLDRQKHLLDEPIIMLTAVRMPDANDLYLEAFWVSLSAADGECRTVTVSDLYCRLCMVMRSVVVLVRMDPIRRLLTREWTDPKYLFQHIIFSNKIALDNLLSLHRVRKIPPILTPLGKLQFGCVSRSHELTDNDPWNALNTTFHPATEGALLDQMGNLLSYVTVENCRQVTGERTMTEEKRSEENDISERASTDNSENMRGRINAPFATVQRRVNTAATDELVPLFCIPQNGSNQTVRPLDYDRPNTPDWPVRLHEEAAADESLPFDVDLAFGRNTNSVDLIDFRNGRHPVFPKSSVDGLIQTIHSSDKTMDEEFRANQLFYETFCCEVKEQPDN